MPSVNVDSGEANDVIVSRPAWHLIQCRAPSKRSLIFDVQVHLLVRVARMLVDETLSIYRVCSTKDLQECSFKDFVRTSEYQLFVEACYATRFVCRDIVADADLERINLRPAEAIGQWGLPQIRHYMHTLLRAERWADGWSSPIFSALQSGALVAVIERLERDSELYAPIK